MICLHYCWIQNTTAMEHPSTKASLSLTDNHSKIHLAQNKIQIDELSYDDVVKSRGSSGTLTPPYKQRRKALGATISLGYSLWNPNNYNSFNTLRDTPPPQGPPQNLDFASLYGTKTLRDGNTGYISFLAALKYNLPTAAALSLGLGAGYYRNKGNNNLDLFMIPITTELTLTIDGIMNEPYFAPYAGIGLAYVYFKETYPTTAPRPDNPNIPNDPSPPPENITTTADQTGNQFVLYYSAGVLLQLDWLEKTADRSMQLIGVENTYIKVGIIHFFRNVEALNKLINKNQVPASRDLTSKIALYVGLQLEF